MGIFRLFGLMIEWFPYILVFVGVYLFLRRLLARSRQAGRSATESPRPVSQLVQDPNCGVYVDAQAAVRRTVGNGQVFFCSEGCADAWTTKRRRA